MRVAVEKLKREYGNFAHHNLKDPYRELIFITCSTMTQEVVYRRVYTSVIGAFPNMQEMASANLRHLRKLLSPGGLGARKAKSMKRSFVQMLHRFGPNGFDVIRSLDDEDLERALTKLPGVGKKVARCVMLYSYGRKVFPVDTHCWRIAKRLGWIPAAKRLDDKGMDLLQEIIPPRWRYSLHVNMVSHGRAICRKKRPLCQECVLSQHCPRHGVDR